MKRIVLFATVCAFFCMPAASGHNALAAQQKEKSALASPPEKSKAAQDSSLSGKVVETMDAGGYTYVQIEKAGKKTWVAVPEMKVAVGQEISFMPGQEMPNFKSKSLNKTFESIIFSGGPATPKSASGLPSGHSDTGKKATGSKAAATAGQKDIKVEKAAGIDAYTVGDVYAKRSALNKKIVIVKGKVVKVSEGIMKANWVHLQDGTGDQKKNTHNLVVTTDDLPVVGEVVTMKGIISKDKDFGAGYKYEVIMEKASIMP